MLSLSFFSSATSSSSSSSSSPSPPLSMLCFRQSLIHLPVFVYSRALHNERLDSLVLLRIKRVETICVSYFRSPVIPLSVPSVLLSVFCRSSPPFLYCVPLLSILTQSPKNLSSVFLYPAASLFPHLLFSSLVPPYFFLSFSPPPTLMLLSYSLILFLFCPIFTQYISIQCKAAMECNATLRNPIQKQAKLLQFPFINSSVPIN